MRRNSKAAESPAVSYIKDKYSFAVKTTCVSSGCSLDLVDLENYVVLDAEKLRDNMPDVHCKMCDHIVFLFNDKASVFIVEQKGATSASEIPGQVQQGANLALEIMSGIGQFKKVSVYLLGLKSKWSKHDLETFRKKRVKLKGKFCYIANLRCGASLASFLKKGKKDGVQYEGLITLN